jgi:hypothetical protein
MTHELCYERNHQSLIVFSPKSIGYGYLIHIIRGRSYLDQVAKTFQNTMLNEECVRIWRRTELHVKNLYPIHAECDLPPSIFQYH